MRNEFFSGGNVALTTLLRQLHQGIIISERSTHADSWTRGLCGLCGCVAWSRKVFSPHSKGLQLAEDKHCQLFYLSLPNRTMALEISGQVGPVWESLDVVFFFFSSFMFS